MTETLASLKARVHSLTPAERVDFAAFLLGAVDPDTGDDPAWRAEVARRVADIRSGAVAGRPVEDMVADLEARAK